MFERDSTRIGIIGAGRLAASLAAALHAAGYGIQAVSSRDEGSARRLAASLGASPRTGSPSDVAACSDLVFLTVPDAAIAEVAAGTRWHRRQAVVHCSGAFGLEALEPARAAGAAVGSFHPLQSFSARDGDPRRFHGITCGIEAAGALSDALEAMASYFGAQVVRLEGVDRAAYHAAAVFASNYVVSIMVAAREAWALAGLPAGSARPALAPLLLGAAQNVAAHELREALTGPVARGDVDTVRRHLLALGDTELADLYRRLGANLLPLELPHEAAIAAGLRRAFDAPAIHE